MAHMTAFKKKCMACANVFLGFFSLLLAGCSTHEAVLMYSVPPDIVKYGVPPDAIAMYGVPSPSWEGINDADTTQTTTESTDTTVTAE